MIINLSVRQLRLLKHILINNSAELYPYRNETYAKNTRQTYNEINEILKQVKAEYQKSLKS